MFNWELQTSFLVYKYHLHCIYEKKNEKKNTNSHFNGLWKQEIAGTYIFFYVNTTKIIMPRFSTKKYIYLNPNHLTVLPIQKKKRFTIHFLLVKLCREKKKKMRHEFKYFGQEIVTCMGCSTTYIIIKISTFRFLGVSF